MATRPAKDWRDSPDASTPISAAALEDLEARAFTYAEQVAAAVALLAGPAGPAGPAGVPGPDTTLRGQPVPAYTAGDAGSGLVWTGAGWSKPIMVVDGDARLSNPRVPVAHKASHQVGGGDALVPPDIGAAPLASPAFTGSLKNTTASALKWEAWDATQQLIAIRSDHPLNLGVGKNALLSNTVTGVANEGTLNSAVGVSALQSNTTGTLNSAVGVSALQSNTTGTLNSAVGVNALHSNTTGYYNSAVGVSALQSNTTGTLNSAVGVSALYSNTTGTLNSAVGVNALYSNTTGTLNSAVGVQAGYTSVAANANTTGSGNTFVGYNTGATSPTQRNRSTALGVYATVNADDALVLGGIAGINGCPTTPNIGIGVNAPLSRLHVEGGDIRIGTAGRGVIMKSPDGLTVKTLTIDNAGALALA